jgi:predicted permease
MTGLLQDLRYALRQLGKSPGFTATAVLVLALGIGTTTGMLAIVQSVLLRPLNYPHPERLLLLGIAEDASGTTPDGQSTIPFVPIPSLREMQRNLHQFEQIAAYNEMPVPVETVDGTQMLRAPEVSTNFFETVGVHPAMGRAFQEGDDATGVNAAIVSHEFWQHSMHARKDVLGSNVKVNGSLCTVVGVMPPRFQFPVGSKPTLWTALQFTPGQKTNQGMDELPVLGRLKPGFTAEQARSEGEAYLRNKPAGDRDLQSQHFWVYPLLNTVTGDEKTPLYALFAACLLLLAIAVVNTANLQIARATRREAEIAMRAALGATRARIVRQMVVENLVLSFAGAALGWLLASGFVETARNLFQHYPRFDELQLDPWTFVGCLLLTVFCGVAASLGPAWHVLKNGSQVSVQHGAAGRVSRPQRLSSVLVVAEVALTCVLLVAAGLFLRTFRSFQNIPLGFMSHDVMGFLLWPQGGNRMPMASKIAAYQRVLDRLEHLPYVESAGLATSVPASNYQMTAMSGFSIPGHVAAGQKDQPSIRMVAISPGYFRAMRIPLLAGRLISPNDTQGTQMVGIVNHKMVETYLHGVNPIGQQIVLDKDAGFPQPVTIVGVSGDTLQGRNLVEAPQPEVDVSFQQLSPSAMFTQYLIGMFGSFAVRARPGAKNVASEIRSVVNSEAPEFAIDGLSPLDELVRDQMKNQRLALEITSVFAWIALLLSAAGLYGVLAYLVGQRVREMGIRLALGATREQVFALVFRRGLWMVGAGLVVGSAAALMAGRWIQLFLFGVTPHDPLTYALVIVLVLLASALAVFVPARRAASIEPTEALRTE